MSFFQFKEHDFPPLPFKVVPETHKIVFDYKNIWILNYLCYKEKCEKVWKNNRKCYNTNNNNIIKSW